MTEVLQVKSFKGADYSPQRRSALIRYGLVSAVVMVLGLMMLAGWRLYQYPYKEIPYPEDYPAPYEQLIAGFYENQEIGLQHYEKLFQYFLAGYQFYRSESGALVSYPGQPSKHGRRVDRLEGFTRMAPLLGAWLYSGREGSVTLPDGQIVDIAVTIKEAIRTGTDPQSSEYWGGIKQKDQRIVEAADVALTLWLSRKQVWDKFDALEQERIAQWLAQVNNKKIPDNNWHLFVALVNAVLLELGREEGSQNLLDEHYQAIKQFYRGNGWFTDGVREGERFDYYNAWGIHYALYWLNKIRPEFDPQFIEEVSARFAEDYQYFFSTEGFPIYGRSICYRMALPAPLLIAADQSPDRVSPGLARRAMDITWRYFIRNGSLHAGTVTQGYCGIDARILEQYSGQGSCLWSLRSLILALSFADAGDYWQAAPLPLPIETKDYAITLDVPGWSVNGDSAQNTVTLKRLDRAEGDMEAHDWEEDGWPKKFVMLMQHEIVRFKNYQAKYFRPTYASQPPFCGCNPPEREN